MNAQRLELVIDRLRDLERAELRRQHKRRRLLRLATLSGMVAVIALPAIASAVEVPNSFSDGAVIEAQAFNDNFSALASAVTSVEDSVAAFGPPITGSASIDVTDNVVSLADDVTTVGDVVVGGGHIRLPIPAPSTWNNAGNGSPALYNNVNHSSCDEAGERGRIRIFVLDESTPDGDNHDALCYCRAYHNDTDGTDTYRWACFHGQNDGT